MLLHHRPYLLLAAFAMASAIMLLARGHTITEGASEPAAVRTDDGSFKNTKLSSPLVALADASTAGAALPKSVHDALAADRIRLSDGDVQVYISIAGDSAVEGIETLGATVELIDKDSSLAQAQVPIERLRAVAALPTVRHVRLPDYAHANAGSIHTEGDAVMKSDELRKLLGVDGSGVTVGVISDGVGGLAVSQGLGDLPTVDTSTCNTYGGDPGAQGAEGTAMLEIVHDIAPGADLMFGNFGFATALDFNDAVDCLAANADIVVDDIGWFGVGPYDGTSFVSENTADALNGPGPIRGYFNAVGNAAGEHYQEPYVASSTVVNGPDLANVPLPEGETWTLHQFDATANTEHAGLVAAPADGNRVVLAEGGTLTAILVWDDEWGDADNDYDMFVREDGSTVNICSGDFQGGPGTIPVEACVWGNFGPGDAELDILIGNYLGSAGAVEFDMFLLCDLCYNLGNGNALDFNTAGSSVPSNSDAGGSPASVISLGAVNVNDPSSIRPYSSRGLTEDGRVKPDIVTADGGCITGSGGFGQGNCQGSGALFHGTSAAAPHAAAVAALLLECDPDMDRIQLYDRMVGSAMDLGDPGADSTFGYGRLNALAAADGCAGAPAPTATTPAAATPTQAVATITATPGAPTTTATPSAPATDTPTFTPTPTHTSAPTPTWTPIAVLFGDASCDGIVNALDTALILQLSAGLTSFIPCLTEADVNEDGLVNAIDGTLILQFSASLIDDLPF